MTSQLFHNARVLTMDERGSEAEAVAVRGGRIVAVGSAEVAANSAGSDADRIDCAGGVLLPAFIDAHCHLLSFAASLRSVDCTGARSIKEIQDAIRRRATETPPGSWIRAFGYEETRLAETRHPTAKDLDAATTEHPVRLVHGSGHARVLNTHALRLAGIDSSTEEPPGGVIERDLNTGEPSGVLIGMERLVDQAVPNLSYEELSDAVREASRCFLNAGITAIQDATHTNGPSEWALFERLMEDGSLPLDVVMMEGSEHLGELPESAVDGRLRRGAVKVMLHELEHIEPDADEVEAMNKAVEIAHVAGRQLAIHAVGEGAVRAVVDALEAALQEQPRADHRHRIEHCSVLPEGMAVRIAELGIIVVSQPSFVRERGDRYRRLLPESQLGRLYAFRTLSEAGVQLAAGSDAPVTRPEPLAAVAAATVRATASGAAMGAHEAVDTLTALRWWTGGAARAAFLEERGVLSVGAIADLVLLSDDALMLSSEELRTSSPKRVWRRGVQVAPDVP
ncbi:MAG: amidohydrolase [Chloroflexi bacterium]|nr:amidohydrolase [Chloroflexota bacterium]